MLSGVSKICRRQELPSILTWATNGATHFYDLRLFFEVEFAAITAIIIENVGVLHSDPTPKLLRLRCAMMCLHFDGTMAQPLLHGPK